jgi:tRNA dimethylallyltransferase
MYSPPTPELPPLIVICGPTAAGKTALALTLAEHYPVEVVSADSRQLYRLMDIGTAKPSAAEQAAVPHHLLDVAWPDEPFDAARFARLASTAITEIYARGRVPLLVGGTGLYIRALTEGLADIPPADLQLRTELQTEGERGGAAALYRRLVTVDPTAAATLHPNDLVRIVRALEVFTLTGQPISSWQRDHGFRTSRYRLLKLGLNLERTALYARIDQRASAMFASGLLEETRTLLAYGYSAQLKSLQTIGYREAVRLLNGACSLSEALIDLQQATRRYAKRQLTWFRADPQMIWVDSLRESDRIRTLIDQFHAR